LRPSFFTTLLWRFSSSFLRNSRRVLRRDTIFKRPLREWLSFGCFFRCFASSSISWVSIAIWTSAEPVSFSCLLYSSMSFCFSFCVSIMRMHPILPFNLSFDKKCASPSTAPLLIQHSHFGRRTTRPILCNILRTSHNPALATRCRESSLYCATSFGRRTI